MKRNIDPDAHVIILGGGKGHVAQFLRNRRRTFVNVDLARFPDPMVRTIVGDMEQPFDRIAIGNAGKTQVVITPLSLEYTDVELSIGNIAQILRAGEKWIWLCHHADSFVVEGFKRSVETADFIVGLLMRMQMEFERPWDRIVEETSRAMLRIYLSGELTLPAGYVLQLDRDLLQRVRSGETESRWDIAQAVAIAATLACQHAELKSSAIEITAQLLETYFQKDKDASTHLLERTFRTPEDLEAAAGNLFRRIDGNVLQHPEGMRVILGVFERT